MRHISLVLIAALALCACTSIAPRANDTVQTAVERDAERQALLDLSRQKWLWMADKSIPELDALFDERSKFVHMSGTWNKDAELRIIESGEIWYKNADVHDAAVEVFDDTAIVWSRITLAAVVRGAEVSTEFTVTEVYQRRADGWKLLDLTFSSVRDTHTLAH